MSYLDQSEIAANGCMTQRIAQCATQEGQDDADTWTYANRREWAAAPGWDEAWAYAKNTHPDPDPEPGEPFAGVYDPGEDEAVITDSMILSQVQSMLAAENG